MSKKDKKKRDKKHVKRPVYYPGLIIQMHSFSEFEKALDDFLDRQQVEIDHEGTFIYKDSSGTTLSFASTLYVYTMLAYIYGTRNGISYDLQPLAILQNRMFERRGFDEEEIDAARKTLKICRQILSKANPKEVRDILQVVKTSLAMSERVTADLSDPETLLAIMVSKMGNIGQEVVKQRHEEYTKLAEEFPDDERIILLRDEYTRFLTAYRFKRVEDARNKGMT